MFVRFLNMLTKVTDFVEPWIFARRAPQDEETEESRGVILASGGDIGVHVLVAGDDCLVVRGGDFMFHEVSERRGKVGGSVRDGVRAWVVGAVLLVRVFENVVGV